MDDPAARHQVAPTEVPPPETGRVLLGELDQGASYRVRRTRGTEDWLLLHTVDGGGIVHGADGTSRITRPGEAVLLRPGTLHDYGTDPAVGRWHLLYSHCHPPATWLALLDWPEAAPGLGRIRLGSEVDERVQQALRAAARAARLTVGRPELFALNGLETALLWYDSQNPRRHQLDERVLAVLEHIDAHLVSEGASGGASRGASREASGLSPLPASRLDTAALAEVAHLSPSRLSHLFSAQVGTPLARYVEAQRLELAARLLEMTSDPVATVARRVGFRDPLHFSRRFRTLRGMSPSEHRAGRR
ncbi:helix-turn-helix domain-containing protein [Brachybacterium sp. AOP43-C2-M15]